MRAATREEMRMFAFGRHKGRVEIGLETRSQLRMSLADLAAEPEATPEPEPPVEEPPPATETEPPPVIEEPPPEQP